MSTDSLAERVIRKLDETSIRGTDGKKRRLRIKIAQEGGSSSGSSGEKSIAVLSSQMSDIGLGGSNGGSFSSEAADSFTSGTGPSVSGSEGKEERGQRMSVEAPSEAMSDTTDRSGDGAAVRSSGGGGGVNEGGETQRRRSSLPVVNGSFSSGMASGFMGTGAKDSTSTSTRDREKKSEANGKANGREDKYKEREREKDRKSNGHSAGSKSGSKEKEKERERKRGK